jgi:N6-L-threonylcarbamoyladenine synthase
VVREALPQAGISPRDRGGIAVTQGPGLIGALLVGISYAKALAYGLNLPVCGINHLEGHLAAARIDASLSYPHVGMVVSGGHTSLYEVTDETTITQIGQTIDDAAGEAFDKVAKLLNLGYPGGAIIEKISRGVDHSAVELQAHDERRHLRLQLSRVSRPQCCTSCRGPTSSRGST